MEKLEKQDLDELYDLIIESGCLGKSDRKKKLFLYLWEKLRKDSDQEITQYTIAFDVLGRSHDFNPETDGIVRADIGRLRNSLKIFSAQSKRYSIEIPKGNYELLVHRKKQSYALKRQNQILAFSFISLLFLSVVSSHLIILSENFSFLNKRKECSTNLPTIELRTNALKNDVEEKTINQYILSAIEGVIAQNSHLSLKTKDCRSKATPQYFLEYTTIEEAPNYRVLLSAHKARSRKKLALIEYGVVINEDGSYEDLFFETAKHVNDIIKPYGVIARNAIHEEWQDPNARNNYACLIKMYDYYDTGSDQDYLKVHACLSHAMDSKNAPLDIRGGLAASYLEQAREYREPTNDDPWGRVEEILSNHEGIINQSAELMIAKMTYEADGPNYSPDRLDNALLTAESTFSTNPTVLLTAAGYAGFKLGDWERANRLSDKTKLLTKQRDQSIYIIDAVNTLMMSKIHINPQDCFKFHSQNSVMVNLIVKSCAIKFDNEFWLNKSGESLNRLGFETIDKQVEFLKKRKWHASVVDTVIDLITGRKL